MHIFEKSPPNDNESNLENLKCSTVDCIIDPIFQ